MAMEYKTSSEEYERQLEKALENPSHLQKAQMELLRIRSNHDPSAFDSGMMDDLDAEILLENDSNNSSGIETDEKSNGNVANGNKKSKKGHNNNSNSKLQKQKLQNKSSTGSVFYFVIFV